MRARPAQPDRERIATSSRCALPPQAYKTKFDEVGRVVDRVLSEAPRRFDVMELMRLPLARNVVCVVGTFLAFRRAW